MMTLFRIDNANDGILYTASSDGTISCTDLDTGIGSPLLNLNPNGWNVSLLSSQASTIAASKRSKELIEMLFFSPYTSILYCN